MVMPFAMKSLAFVVLEWLKIEQLHPFTSLADSVESIHLDIFEALRNSGCRPPDFNCLDPFGPAQTDLLSER